MKRIGVDVGDTNTDAAILDRGFVIGVAKCPTSQDLTRSIAEAINAAMVDCAARPSDIGSVMIGTTCFLNALVQQRDLARVAVLRLCGPATMSLPPMIDWPSGLRTRVEGLTQLLPGGFEYDGSPISDLDADAIRQCCKAISDQGIASVAITGVFALVSAEQERAASRIIAEQIPDIALTRSAEIGRLGFLERENATILNACLKPMARHSVNAFRTALDRLGLICPLHFTQNDGTVLSAEQAEAFPVLTFSSGPTNSMRGAAFLSARDNAVVVDIGGTTCDVGVLINGFPRETAVETKAAGVRTNFRMPDIYSFGLGGGSRIRRCSGEIRIGPDSVGHRLQSDSLVFGGATETATDIAVASGKAAIGDASRVGHLSRDHVAQVGDAIQARLEHAIDLVKHSPDDIPVVLVGGGSILAGLELEGASEVIRPEHFTVANAVGAAIGQVSAEIDRILPVEASMRDAVLDRISREAISKVENAGADPASVTIVDVNETPLAYLPGNATRIHVKAVGELRV